MKEGEERKEEHEKVIVRFLHPKSNLLGTRREGGQAGGEKKIAEKVRKEKRERRRQEERRVKEREK